MINAIFSGLDPTIGDGNVGAPRQQTPSRGGFRPDYRGRKQDYQTQRDRADKGFRPDYRGRKLIRLTL